MSLMPLSLAAFVFLLRAPISRRLNSRVRVGRWLVGLYLAWMALDRNVCKSGGRPVHWARRNPLWRLFRSYFKADIIYDFGEDEHLFDSDVPLVLGCHPHGVVSLSVFANVVFHSVIPIDYRIATVAANFIVPFWRDILLALGFVDANRATLKSLLVHGKSEARRRP